MSAIQAMSIRRRAVILLGAMVGIVAGSLSLLAAPASAGPAPITWQSVNLNADAPNQLVGRTVTLTANGSDVGPTPWYIETYDQTTGRRVCLAGTGTTCVYKVSYAFATKHTYISYIASPSATDPPPNVQYVSQPVTVTWQSPIVLNANRTYLQSGEISTLTALSSYDVGPTPYYIQIYDKGTGQRLVACGRGSACSASVAYQNNTTHTYIAYIAASSSTLTPSVVQGISNNVSVQWWLLA